MFVCTLGDVTLDLVAVLRTPIADGGDAEAEIRVSPGGQAVNVAAWAAALGAGARVVAKRGNDLAGELAAKTLAERGVEVAGPKHGRNGTICSLVSPDGQRSMVSDRGASAGLRADELDVGWFAGCDHLAVSGYALMREPARAAARRAVALARPLGAAVSVDLASWSGIRDVGAEAFRRVVEQLEPDVVFANEEELETIGGRFAGPAWIVKRGGGGCSFDGDERPALPVERVVDTTGAGDALAAGWIVGGPELALEAAARCVATVGSMPP
jgi:ribokinase